MEKAMAPHSSVLAWRIPGTEETSGLPSMGLHRGRHDWSSLAAAASHLGSPQNPLQAWYRCRKWDSNRQTGLNLALNSDSSHFQFCFFFFFNQIVPHSRIAELTVGLGQVIFWMNTVVRVFYFLEILPFKNHFIRRFINAGSQTGTNICM